MRRCCPPTLTARDCEAGQSTGFVPARKGPEIWLPYDLILERLPVQKQCQLRCVCKAWNVMLRQHKVLFTEAAEAEKEQEYWFIMARAFSQDEPGFASETLPLAAVRYEHHGAASGGRALIIIITIPFLWLHHRHRAFSQDGSAKVHWEFLTYSSLHKQTERPPLPNRNHCSLRSLLGGTHCRRLAFEQENSGQVVLSWTAR
ncbi:hypothetical protein GOP47_0007395 [Adiantum capillus-veneris]|uniref:F-box domain-containing protein n=1 Tax=Adiantum capillus-veneris TaxID=13818 RepID=A0A9D4V178_ADICA|nr:hypothetical protein GOP47_0007395 [Adiantum capillus-veneris]